MGEIIKCEVPGCTRSAYYQTRTYVKNVLIKVCTEHGDELRKAGRKLDRLPSPQPVQPVTRADAPVKLGAIESFRDEFEFLLNFYPVEIEYEGLVYLTVEHAFQAAKTLEPDERKPFTDSAVKPGSVKRMGRKVKLRSDWEAIKVSVMKQLVAIKFANPTLRELLLGTGDRELIEGNNWNDRFWGVCKGKGQNHLGRVLMEVRAESRHHDLQSE